MDHTENQIRTEPRISCRLEILVSAYFTVVDGTKMYNKGRTVSWVVDSEDYTLTNLERDIGPYFHWGSYQKANFWFLEKNAMKFKLDSDAQLLELVRSTEVLKLMMIVGRREEMEEPAIHKVRAATNEVRKDVPAVAEVMDQEVPSAADVDMGPELSEVGETLARPPRSEEVPNAAAAVDIGPELRELPEFGETTAGPPRAEEEEKEHFMTVGCDPDGDEPAGADEEWRYFKNVDDDNVKPIKNVEVELQNRKRSRPMPYFDTEAVPNDEADLVDDFIVDVSSCVFHFFKETNANWAWFMDNLRRAVGTPPGLTIHTDACKGLAYAVKKVFKGEAEHRECSRHLMANFRKKFKGDVLKYMWPCAWACTTRRHDTLKDKIAETCPKAIPWLNKYHNLVWSRSKFSKECKVDYVNNNISECFNNWIKDEKELPAVYLMDAIREKIMVKISTRKAIAEKLDGRILPSVLHELNMKSRGLHYDYTHAIFLIGKVRQLKIEDFVDDFYSVQRFKQAYQFEVTPMGDKSQWPKNDPPFEVVPPPLERPAGRPRKQRIKASGEPGKRGPYQCKRCFQFGHIEKGCSATQAELEQELPPPRPKKPKQQSY